MKFTEAEDIARETSIIEGDITGSVYNFIEDFIVTNKCGPTIDEISIFLRLRLARSASKSSVYDYLHALEDEGRIQLPVTTNRRRRIAGRIILTEYPA